MAITARLDHDGEYVSIEFYPGRRKFGVIDFPDDRDWPIDFNYDDESLDRGEPELLGVEVLFIGILADEWLDELDKLDLPHVDIPEFGFSDAKLSDVLRWARARYGRKPEYAAHS